MEVKQAADVAARHRSILSSRPQNQIGFGSTSASGCLFLLRSAQLRWINRNLHEYHFSRPLSARATAEHRAASNSPDIELGVCVIQTIVLHVSDSLFPACIKVQLSSQFPFYRRMSRSLLGIIHYLLILRRRPLLLQGV